ncbi:MAG TPA: PaaI family thioesterase [Candidatus Wallbacteria bacterium]|nr:PaaI family thioesterase [Candidatus Wallbacteria bacterium]
MKNKHYNCWACGAGNKSGLGLDVKINADGYAEAFFKAEKFHEGHPGIVHGGLICSILDSVMTHAAFVSSNKHALTARLDVRFKRPAKVGETLYVICRHESHHYGFMKLIGKIINEDKKIVATAAGLFSVKNILEAK